MRVLLDTNVVARLLPREGSTRHLALAEAIAQLRSEKHELFLVPQVLYEFWVIATRSPEQNGFGLLPAAASQDVQRLEELFSVLRDERTVLDHWRSLVVQHAVVGKGAHDARLVAAMIRHRLTHLMTFNLTDFKRYPMISLLDPSEFSAAKPGT